jgi:hypothetical protein
VHTADVLDDYPQEWVDAEFAALTAPLLDAGSPGGGSGADDTAGPGCLTASARPGGRGGRRSRSADALPGDGRGAAATGAGGRVRSPPVPGIVVTT